MTISIKELARLREQTGFLGYEFLTWLFLLLDREDAKEKLAAIIKPVMKSDVAVLLGTRLVLGFLNNPQQKIAIESPILEGSHEVFASLKNGHVIEALSLSIGFDTMSVSFMMQAQDFSLSQIKIKNTFLEVSLEPDNEGLSEEDKTREDFFLRMAVLANLECLMDAFFNHFLLLRIDMRYGAELLEMRRHIENRLHQFLEQSSANRKDVAISPLRYDS